jgi:hypothetical protein
MEHLQLTRMMFMILHDWLNKDMEGFRSQNFTEEEIAHAEEDGLSKENEEEEKKHAQSSNFQK